MWRRPAHTDRIKLIGPNTGKFEAGMNGSMRESGIVLDTANPLFGDGKNEFAVPGNARG